MRVLLFCILGASVVFLACNRRKPASPTTSAEAAVPAAPQPPVQPAEVSAPSAPAGKPQPSAAQLEAGVEFGDLNNLIAGFENRNKRLPTAEELKKLYFGGTRPIPIPPGYKLVIDPRTKSAKLVPGN